jgi:hypothetical protein
MLPVRPDRPLPAPIWICPICQKLMRTGTIEIADGKEQTKLACATCGTQATQSEFADQRADSSGGGAAVKTTS